MCIRDSVVEGHLLALERAAPGTRYILGGPNATYHELFALLAKVTGTPAPTRHIPFWVMELAGRMMRWRAGLTGAEPLITDEVVRIYRHDWAYRCLLYTSPSHGAPEPLGFPL